MLEPIIGIITHYVMAPPRKPRINKSCPYCKNEFKTIDSKNGKMFCSKKCDVLSRTIENTEERKVQARKWARDYRRTHPEWTRATQKRARTKLKQNNPAHLIWMETKKRAKKRGIPFTLEVSDIIIPRYCPILDLELSFGKGSVHDASPSLDRIVPNLGYIKGNCFIISSKANRMKQENTLESLEKIVLYIKERMK